MCCNLIIFSIFSSLQLSVCFFEGILEKRDITVLKHVLLALEVKAENWD
jgi:hypothetical protein